MRIAISITTNSINADINPRFGRASNFLIYNDQDDSYKVIDNSVNLEAAQGAGIQTAQNLIDSEVDVVITGHCGPKAFKLLRAADIKISLISDIKVGSDVLIKRFKADELKFVDSPDVEGHWV